MNLGKGGVAHIEDNAVGLKKFEEQSSGWPSGPGDRLKVHHAVKNDSRRAWLTHGVPFC